MPHSQPALTNQCGVSLQFISQLYHSSLFLLTAIEWHDTSKISALTDIGLTNPLTL